jgi:hypothetical protein
MATMIHPLQWGQSLTCIFPVLLFFYKAKVFLISKSLFLTGMTFVLVNIFLSGSRSAMVALLLFGCIYFLQVEFKKRIRFLTVFVIFFILFCVSESKFLEQMLDIVTSSVIFWNDSYSDAVGIQGSSVAMRLGQLYGTFESISNNPLFGMGKGYVTYQSFDSNDGTSGMFGYESVFFYKMVEEGVLGTFCFFLMYYKLYAATIKQIKKSNILRNFKRIVSGHYLSYLVAILFTGIQGSFTLFTLLSISIISFTVLQNSKNQSLSSFTVSSK